MIPTYKIVLGTANYFNDYFGTHVTEKQADKIIKYAKEVGIKEFDTARTYADGKVEEYLSKIDGIKVYTKGDSLEEFYKSKDVLGNKIIGWLIHHPTLNYPYYKHMKQFISESPIIGNRISFGISGYSLREVEKFKDAVGIDFCQLPWAQAMTVEFPVIVRSIFEKRELLIKNTVKEILTSIGEHSEYWDRVVIGVDNVDQLKEIVDIWREL